MRQYPIILACQIIEKYIYDKTGKSVKIDEPNLNDLDTLNKFEKSCTIAMNYYNI